MGTRSVIAIPQGDGWKGRYVHWDGYPDGVGEAVREIVVRDGLETAIRVLTEEHYGWSTVTANPDQELGPHDDPSRFVAVPGYGVAYVNDTEQPDEWITAYGDDGGTEWAYVLYPGRIAVLENTTAGWRLRDELTLPHDPVLQAGLDSGRVKIVRVTP